MATCMFTSCGIFVGGLDHVVKLRIRPGVPLRLHNVIYMNMLKLCITPRITNLPPAM